jgi:hypothetical protein
MRTFGKGSDEVVDLCGPAGLLDGLVGGVLDVDRERDVVADRALVQRGFLRHERQVASVRFGVHVHDGRVPEEDLAVSRVVEPFDQTDYGGFPASCSPC